ncbi:DUF4023 domain-containing protein [Neobacillus sp. OS1-32]|jgi:hypothetical protein|uniref:DUF4023 domain-containing protein n=1 Tax=Neobacillus paridis TaxID=2803862 RepID=A0ABS1TPJ1_9BACI|nr:MULTISPECIES: DUF4023 domain-containing protein [Neobacillus]MBL4953244.1 DUF4023 domain-containing protein [Neobacillus paridis]WML29673.1 DUF4023 domain-containing protein [Neobacillus sp. OS1-32]
MMEQGSTHEFVEKLHEKQEKNRKNQHRQGDNAPSKRLPNKEH